MAADIPKIIRFYACIFLVESKLRCRQRSVEIDPDTHSAVVSRGFSHFLLEFPG
jgi:hypothetical protein